MASKDRKTRCREAAGILLLFVFLSARRIHAAGEESGPLQAEILQRGEWAIMDRLIQAYGETDWTLVAASMASHPEDEGNPNIMFIPLSLGNVYLNRYEWRNDISDFERALASFEWVSGSHQLWGDRWLSAPVISYLDLSLVRLRSACAPPAFAERIEGAWQAALAVTEEEADARLTPAFPYRPYDSSETGDSKGEENAWEAGLLAAAANFLPERANAAAWDQKARELAYDAVTRPSDPPDATGLKTATVADDF